MSKYKNYDTEWLLSSATYGEHVSAMTKEELHNKSDIAAELAWRDEQLAKANERVAELESYNVRLANESHEYQQRCAELGKENKRESMELRSRLGSALGRNSEMVEQLAKANERIALLERVEKIFNESPELTFENVKGMFNDELNKFAIEKKIEGVDDFMHQFRYEYEGARDTDSIESFADAFTEQLRKE